MYYRRDPKYPETEAPLQGQTVLLRSVKGTDKGAAIRAFIHEIGGEAMNNDRARKTDWIILTQFETRVSREEMEMLLY